MKRAPTGNKRGRPKATEVVARTNHKVDEFYRRKPVQSDAQMPLVSREEKISRRRLVKMVWSTLTPAVIPCLDLLSSKPN